MFCCNLIAQNKISFNTGYIVGESYYTKVPYDTVRNKAIVIVEIKGKFYRFLLDTGAPLCVTEELVREIGGEIIDSINVTDQSGLRDNMKIARIKELKIGEVTFMDTPGVVVDNSAIFTCYNVSGFIGSNMLRNSILQVNGFDKTVTISSVIEKIAPKSAPIPLYLNKVQSSPFIHVNLSDRKHCQQMAMVDTGMDGLFDLHHSNFKKLKRKKIFRDISIASGSNTIGLHGPGASMDQVKGRIPSIALGDKKFLNVSVQTTRGGESRLGADIFRHGIMTIDYRNKQFYFDPVGNPESDMFDKLFPISPTIIDQKLKIGVIWDESYSDKLSLMDEIIAIDGKDYINFDICDLYIKESPFKGKESINLKIRDKNGVEKDVLLTRK